MKLRRSTIIVIILSWILFFCTCFFIVTKLNQVKEDKITNDKIFKSDKTPHATTAKKKVKSRDAAVVFMKAYYQALEQGKEKTLSTMVEDPATLKSKRTVAKLKSYVEAYKNLNFTLEDGLDETSFIVYATYDTKLKDIKTPVPGLSQYYIQKKGSSFVLYNNEKHYTKEIAAALKDNMKKDGIHKMMKTTNDAYEQALASDKELRKFFKNE